MPDERVITIAADLKQARSLVMKAARAADEIHSATCHMRLMLAADAIDDAYEANEGTESKLRMMEAAYDADSVDFARRERGRP